MGDDNLFNFINFHLFIQYDSESIQQETLFSDTDPRLLDTQLTAKPTNDNYK